MLRVGPGLSVGLSQSGRDRVVDLIDQIPLVSRAEAERLVSDVEDVVGDAARDKVMPLIIGAGAVGGLALILAIKNRRA